MKKYARGKHPNSGFQKGNKMGVGKTEEKSNSWKGDKAGCGAMHEWVKREKGKASEHKCVDCGKKSKDWSNIDHKYKRNLDDYQSRCRKCHRRYDKIIKNK